LIVAGISLLSIFPAARLPRYAPGELSAEDIVAEQPEKHRPETRGAQQWPPR
jgi:hypothetical protein